LSFLKEISSREYIAVALLATDDAKSATPCNQSTSAKGQPLGKTGKGFKENSPYQHIATDDANSATRSNDPIYVRKLQQVLL
jgi:hypothetical protein